MHSLETLVSTLTVGELANRIGIPLQTLVDRVAPRATRIVEPAPSRAEIYSHRAAKSFAEVVYSHRAAKSFAKVAATGHAVLAEGIAMQAKASKASRAPRKYTSMTEEAREIFDSEVLKTLRRKGSTGSTDLRTALPASFAWATVLDLRAALARLVEAKRVRFTGNTRARKYRAL